MAVALALFIISLLYILWNKLHTTPAALFLFLNGGALLWYYKGIFFGYSEVILRNRVYLKIALLPKVSYLYAATFPACFISLWGLKKYDSKTSIQFDILRNYEEKFRQLFYNKQSLSLFILLTIFLIFIFLWHLNKIDLHTLWENKFYLKISDAEGIGLTSPILQIFHTSLGIIIGLLAFTFFALSIRNKLYLPASIFFLFGIYALVFKLAGNSRWASVMILIMIPFLFDIKNAKMLALCGIIFLCGFFAYRMALFGRSQYYQGVSTLSGNFGLIIEKILDEGFISYDLLEFSLSNILAGANDLSLAIQKGPLSYPEKYKVLSSPPLLSVMDGYDSIRKLYQYKIVSYMPFNFYAELYFFGIKYWVAIFCFFILGLRVLKKATCKYGIIGSILATPGLFCFFVMRQYSIRTCFRYFVASIILVLVFDSFQKRKLRAHTFKKIVEQPKTYCPHAS